MAGYWSDSETANGRDLRIAVGLRVGRERPISRQRCATMPIELWQTCARSFTGVTYGWP
jgi:hypothetical protein